MIVLVGRPALSPYQRDRLEHRLRQIHAPLRVAGSHWMYFIDAQPGTKPEREMLGRVLQADVAPAQDLAGSLLVVPRLGTISPWASKATEILRGPDSPCIGSSADPGCCWRACPRAMPRTGPRWRVRCTTR
jgi:phosphoribosylformylglycinamidine synthase